MVVWFAKEFSISINDVVYVILGYTIELNGPAEMHRRFSRVDATLRKERVILDLIIQALLYVLSDEGFALLYKDEIASERKKGLWKVVGVKG